MEYLFEMVILFVLLFLSGFFSSAEVALVSISRIKIRHLVEKKVKGAKLIQKLKKDPEKLLTIILIGNNIVNVGAAAIATKVAMNLFDNNAVGIATGIMTFLLLVFGEIIPKNFATKFGTRLSLLFAPIIYFLGIILFPIVKIFEIMLIILNKITGLHKKKNLLTEDELKSIVKLGSEDGAINDHEKKMIQRIFDLDANKTFSIMTKRCDMIVVNCNLTVIEALEITKKKHYSRIPVYDTKKNHIVGILNLKDIVACIKNDKEKILVKDIMKKPIFVFGSRKIDSLLRLFQKKQTHIAIVVDNYSKVIGLVTIEDVLEEIVGEIYDETDDLIKKINL
jgi:magnesium and cobalt exporter, CNNM family